MARDVGSLQDVISKMLAEVRIEGRREERARVQSIIDDASDAYQHAIERGDARPWTALGVLEEIHRELNNTGGKDG